MMTTTLPHVLERTIVINAGRAVVFRFFTDSERWASWWGKGSTIDPRPGGTVLICNPGGHNAAGEVIEIAPPDRFVFTYGFVGGKPIPEGSSLVTITLDDEKGATRLNLSHAFAEAGPRDEHIQGWRYQLSLFGNVVANEVHAGAAETVDGWFTAWSEPDTVKREATLDRIASSGVRFRDRFSLIDGMADLRPHLAAVHKFMPGTRLERTGNVRHCQGTVLADWIAKKADGQEIGRGTNVFTVGPDARITSVVGFWT